LEEPLQRLAYSKIADGQATYVITPRPKNLGAPLLANWAIVDEFFRGEGSDILSVDSVDNEDVLESRRRFVAILEKLREREPVTQHLDDAQLDEPEQ
jgi:hypothetical protein